MAGGGVARWCGGGPAAYPNSRSHYLTTIRDHGGLRKYKSRLRARLNDATLEQRISGVARITADVQRAWGRCVHYLTTSLPHHPSNCPCQAWELLLDSGSFAKTLKNIDEPSATSAIWPTA